jgi:hypothetical protein
LRRIFAPAADFFLLLGGPVAIPACAFLSVIRLFRHRLRPYGSVHAPDGILARNAYRPEQRPTCYRWPHPSVFGFAAGRLPLSYVGWPTHRQPIAMTEDFITGNIEQRREQYLALAEEADRHAARSSGELKVSHLKLAAAWRHLASELSDPRMH